MAVWKEYSLRQIVVMNNLCCRAQWREQAFLAAIHGVNPGKEPAWNFGQTENVQAKALQELLDYKKRKAEIDAIGS